MKTLELFVLLAVLGGSQGSPASALDTVPPCPPAEAAATNTWRTESFEGVSLTLPRAFRTAAPCCFDHGGKAWTNGRLTVTLTKGLFGPTSFVNFASGCRAEVRGRLVLLNIDVQTRSTSVRAWDPAIRAGSYGVVVYASGPGAGDLPTLRSIVLSVAN